MNKMLIIAVVFMVSFYPVMAQEKIGKYIAYEDYHIDSISSKWCDIDVRTAHVNGTTLYYVMITEARANNARESVALIGYNDFLELLYFIDSVIKDPTPNSDAFVRKYVCGTFTFGYGSFYKGSSPMFYMIVDENVDNSMVTFKDQSYFKDIFLKAADKIFELKNNAQKIQ